MSPKTSIKVLLGLLVAVVVFHCFIIAKIIPYTIAWGGRIETDEQMYVFESISIGINLFLIVILLIKGNFITSPFWKTKTDHILWIFFVIFIMNTVGNTFAKTDFEKFFALITLLFAGLIGRILIKRKRSSG